MNYRDKNQQLTKYVNQLKREMTELLPDSPEEKVLRELAEDLQEDYYTIVVVGEFKHGKSTFVNALLKQEVMPVDVTPTTATINAVFYGEDSEVQILKTNGEIEKQQLSAAVLNQYTATAHFDPNEIKYLKLFMPSSLLKKRVVLVDTPGVNDLNQHRTDVTHRFIPRADVILFMLDLTAPMKQTEKLFLENQLLKEGTDRILYVANFLDRVDEEELDDTVDLLKRRVQQITKQANPQVFPVSALQGLKAKLAGDEKGLSYSGLTEVEQQIAELIEKGSRSEEKLARFHERLAMVHESVLAEVETVELMSKQSLENLQQQLTKIEEWLSQKEDWEGQIHQYVASREEEIQFMVQKSATYFGDRLKADLETKIDLFQGNDVKALVETQLPITIRTQFEQWVSQYSDLIQELFRKLKKELAQGLSKTFEQTVQIQSQQEEYRYEAALPMITSQTGNASIKAGLAVGGASTLALLLGGPFLIPIVGMAGLPFLQQKIAESQMEKIKPELKDTIENHTDVIIKDFKRQLQQYVAQSVQEIKRTTLAEFERLIRSLRSKIESEISSKQSEQRKELDYQQALKELREKIQAFEKEGEREHERV
ncbi:dynamin family protein [Bacillus solitudinis]|uniref:dynamin family protein n=1 Tax=Bacillus solitudinis TaxID=2014074 RepID=UPI000C243F65|nr:dynamin family protein [Bacillus solitudinis]